MPSKVPKAWSRTAPSANNATHPQGSALLLAGLGLVAVKERVFGGRRLDPARL